MEEECDDYEEDWKDEEESDGLILSFQEDGTVDAIPKKDYESIVDKQHELINEFVRENLESFKQFLDKKGISEDEFNGKTLKNNGKRKNG